MAAQLGNEGQLLTTPVADVAAAYGQVRTSDAVFSGNLNGMLCQQVFGFNS
jgi:hypothetical protein